MRKQAVVFDLDGTLLDTLEDLADSGNHALAEHGFPVHPIDAYRHFIGDGIEVLIRRMLPEEKRDEQTIAKIGPAYRAQYGRRWNAKTKPYDGIPEMLDALTERGVKMAVFSNKPDEFTQMCVDELLAPWRFDVVLGNRQDVPRKPDPSGALQIAAHWNVAPPEIVYVGDTATDMQTAVAARMVPVGVTWGFRTADELQANGAAVLVERPGELLDLLDGPE